MKCSVYIATSLDGFIARANGELDWLPQQAEAGEDYGYQAFSDSVDVLIIGRRSYEAVLTFAGWPYAGKRVVVLTSSPGSLPAPPAEDVEALSLPPREVVARLEAVGARHAYVDGGQTIRRFLRDGLIDEITITTIPILIGSGLPLFGALDHDVRLRHAETRSYPSGLVQSRYSVERAP